MRQRFHDAVRGFRSRRGVAAAIVATVTVAVGANCAVFSVVDAVLLRPLPYPAADRLVAVYELNRGLKQATQLVAPVRLEEWNSANVSFEGLAGSYFENMTDTGGAEPQRVEAMRVSPRFFQVLGVGAALGRTPVAAEERFGGPPSIVISDGYWRRRFAADPSIAGRAIVLNGVSRTIVGVMPASFRYPTPTTDAWVPAQMPAGLMRERRARFYTAVGRLKPGVEVGRAAADLTTIQTRLGEAFPETDKGWGATIVPLKDEQIGGAARPLWVLFGAVGLVLVVACGNVACLLLADAARRRHDIAVRFALGASRATVAAQLVVEGLLLSAAGSACGVLLARWSIEVLRKSESTLPQIDSIRIDARLLLFTATAAALTTILSALAPALAAASADPASALARGGRTDAGGPRRGQHALVAVQVALAIVLLVGAGLLARSFARLRQVPLGLDPAQVFTFRMSASWSEAADAVVERQARTAARLEEVPGVASAAVSQTMPADVAFPPGQFGIVGHDPAEKLFAAGRMVSGSYFRTLRIPILQGATCSSDPAAPLFTKALVTRAFADRFFPGVNPIGHKLTSPGFPSGTELEIAGVTGDVRESGPLHAVEPLIYWCGYSPYWPDPHFIVRVDPSHPASVAAIRAALLATEPRRAMYGVAALSDTLSASISRQRITMNVLAAFASTALALAAMGLYAVLSELVAARRREIGVRLALGARPSQIVAAVAAQAATATFGGIAAGVAAAFALARFMAALVFGVTTYDPVTFTLVPVGLGVVAMVAALVPARRAVSVDPMEALRQE